MGNFMIPVCCVCGVASPRWHDRDWELKGGLQDFCPFHANDIQRTRGLLQEFMAPHLCPDPMSTTTKFTVLAAQLQDEAQINELCGSEEWSELLRQAAQAMAEADITARLVTELQLKADMFDYLCWLEHRQAKENGTDPEHLCLASDGTTCWGETYADAVRVAMEHDKGIEDRKET